MQLGEDRARRGAVSEHADAFERDRLVEQRLDRARARRCRRYCVPRLRGPKKIVLTAFGALRASSASASQARSTSSFSGYVTLHPVYSSMRSARDDRDAVAARHADRHVAAVDRRLRARNRGAAAGCALCSTGSPISASFTYAPVRQHQTLEEPEKARDREVFGFDRLGEDRVEAAELAAEHVGEELVADDGDLAPAQSSGAPPAKIQTAAA